MQGKKCVVAFKSEKYLLRLFITCKSILFSRLRLFNSKTCDDLTDKKNLNPSICSRHSDEMNKLSMKVSLRKRELLPYITLVRDNQLACYRWLYMYVVFFKSLDLNVMEEWMFTYVMIHMFCALYQQETSSWLFDLEYKHQYWKICVHLILRIVDWR